MTCCTPTAKSDRCSVFQCLPCGRRWSRSTACTISEGSTAGSGPVASWNLRLILGSATRTICVAQSELEVVAATVGARLARRALVVHNGVAAPEQPTLDERRAVREELGLTDPTVVGVVVGSLDERKDPVSVARAATEAWRDGETVTVLFVGDGPARRTLDHLASRIERRTPPGPAIGRPPHSGGRRLLRSTFETRRTLVCATRGHGGRLAAGCVGRVRRSRGDW